jgi:hypothetical protein
MSEDHGQDTTCDQEERDRGPATSSQCRKRTLRVDDVHHARSVGGLVAGYALIGM